MEGEIEKRTKRKIEKGRELSDLLVRFHRGQAIGVVERVAGSNTDLCSIFSALRPLL